MYFGKVNVYNISDGAKDHKYFVTNVYDGELWFWGAYDDHSKALSVAKEIGGVVVENPA